MQAEAKSSSTRRIAAILVVLLGGGALWWLGGSGVNLTSGKEALSAVSAGSGRVAADDPRLAASHRFEDGGWIYVHLEGDPATVGFQHGYLLGPEIEDAFKAVSAEMMHETQRDWGFFRKAAHEMLWPKIDAEYKQELQGIVDGLHGRTSSKLDVDDIVAFNAFEELPDYYVPWYNKQQKMAHAPDLKSPGNCSAFVATGSWTKDGKIVIAHNNWTSYANGERWRIVFDIAPKSGYRMLMDGFPGVIASDDDFGINSDGLMVTETTITQFEGWNPDGKAEFARARKALQYAGSIDDYTKIMLDGNNGGYANDWLLGDSKTGEIAQLELGLKAYKLWRTKNGALAGSNWARDARVIKLDTPQFEPNNMETSPNARKVRWEELLNENKGKIDVDVAEKMLADHVDSYHQKPETNERTLCGHVDSSPRGVDVWGWAPYFPGGAVQAKATDSSMTKEMKMMARAGHPCGDDFLAKPFLAAHPEYAWQAPFLRDMKAGPWMEFQSGQKPGERKP
ncbi:MAG TPA: C45 family peptidase [Candidatus Methylomirabilis sp.]|nr:C45 family peptidase [Candidatus Methylomirabilis sp.]